MARMVKLSWENANFKMYSPPPQKKLNFLQKKKLTAHPLENLEHPDKELKSLGIILIPWKNLKLFFFGGGGLNPP